MSAPLDKLDRDKIRVIIQTWFLAQRAWQTKQPYEPEHMPLSHEVFENTIDEIQTLLHQEQIALIEKVLTTVDGLQELNEQGEIKDEADSEWNEAIHDAVKAINRIKDELA